MNHSKKLIQDQEWMDVVSVFLVKTSFLRMLLNPLTTNVPII